MMHVRRSEERGYAEQGWLKSHHTFSFSEYYDPAYMGFSDLRVINEDTIEGGKGFETHSHRDMEIITYVLEGELEHKDSMGTGSIILPGDVQRMSAGTGVSHSEFNHSKTKALHLLQIWILPAKKSTQPGYEQKNFTPEQKKDRLLLVGSQDGREGSVTIHQDVQLYAGVLSPGKEVKLEINSKRKIWVQVMRGKLYINGEDLIAGDGAALVEEKQLLLKAKDPSEVLVFDLP